MDASQALAEEGFARPGHPAAREMAQVDGGIGAHFGLVLQESNLDRLVQPHPAQNAEGSCKAGLSKKRWIRMDERRLPAMEQKPEGVKGLLEARWLGHYQGMVDACADARQAACGSVRWRFSRGEP